MRTKSIGIGVGLICLSAFLICLRPVDKAQPLKTQPPSKGEWLPSSTSSSQDSQISGQSLVKETSNIQESPYAIITPELLREARERNQSWSNHYRVSDTWTVQIGDREDLSKAVSALNGKFIESVAGFPDMVVIQVEGSEQEPMANQVRSMLQQQSGVKWFEQEIIETFALRYDESPPPFSDPMLDDQWHLRNVGDRWNVAGEDSNIYPAWNEGVSGAGIFLAVVDTGTQGFHPDLAANYREDLEFDYIDNDSSAAPNSSEETHGTAVSGVAAAAANDVCGVGAAFNAELIGVRLIHESQGVSTSRQASAVSHRSDLVDIYNNSWGPDTENGARMAGPGNLAFSAMKQAIENGRDGLGAIYVWAAGNGRSIGSNVNYDGWASHRYSIAVGAVGDHGKLSRYSEPGASMLVCAHSNGDTSGIRTTDLQGQAGADPGDCRIEFGGTSSAAPLVAGIVALMLESNSDLTWRDVQHILAKTAVKVATTNSDWSRNGAGYWINHNFGFGRVDAAAAVKVAKDWISVGEEQSVDSNVLSLDQSIPDNSTAGIEAFHTVNEHIRMEHVAVTLNMKAAEGSTMDWGNLKITLTSPRGTVSILAEPHTDTQESYPEWTYWTVRNWDEDSQGTWKLKIEDLQSNNLHIATSWGLEIFGTEITEQDNRIPVAVRDDIAITETTSFLDVTDNDTDEDSDPLEVISIYRSPHSSVTLTPSGLIEYTPGPGLKGRDRFAYTMHDGRGGIKTAEVHLTILRPEANDDQVATSREEMVVIPVLDNDIDYDGDNIRIKEFSSPQHGVAELQGFINLAYTPEAGFLGVDRFTYTITDDEDGDATAEVTVYVTANVDYALLFDGDDDQIIIENSEDQQLDTAFTIEAWIRPSGWGEGELGFARIFDKDNVIFYLHGTGNPDYNPHSLLILLDHSNGSQSILNTPTDSILLNRWQHVAISYDNISEVHMYIDGIEQTLDTPGGPGSGPVADSGQAIIIGEAANQLRAFEGAIDEFRVWNRSLPLSEINIQKDNRLSGEELGLFIYYSMNEGLGTQLADAGNPVRNGNINGPAWIRGIIGENAPPQTTTDEIHGQVDEKLIISVTGNDTDPDGDEISIDQILNVSNGSASILGGSIIYQPPPGFTGLVRIDYAVSDGYNGTTTSTLILAIGEGLYYTVWEANNYAGGLGGAEDDTDFDSLSNFTEYAFGTDPLSGFKDPARWNLVYDPESGKTTFTYTLLQESLDVEYRLLQSSDLENWSIPTEGDDYEVLSVIYLSPATETRILEFQPPDGNRVFLKLEALSLRGSQ